MNKELKKIIVVIFLPVYIPFVFIVCIILSNLFEVFPETWSSIKNEIKEQLNK